MALPSLRLSEAQDKISNYYKSNNSHNTFRSYLNSYKSLIRIIGDKKNDLICKADIEEFKIVRSQEINLVSTNIDIRNIKAIFSRMVELSLLEYSKVSSVKQFKIEKTKILAINTADIVSILNNTNDKQLTQIIRFTLLTASRISEVLNVKIRDIDFSNEVISIFQQKTNCYKTIPLTDRLFDLLKEIGEDNSEENIISSEALESYLFFNKFKNDPFSRLRADSVSKKFKKILRKLHLNNDFKFHSLRHSAITELISNNVPLNVVKEIAGHKSITTTMVYSHVNSDDLKRAVNSLNY